MKTILRLMAALALLAAGFWTGLQMPDSVRQAAPGFRELSDLAGRIRTEPASAEPAREALLPPAEETPDPILPADLAPEEDATAVPAGESVPASGPEETEKPPETREPDPASGGEEPVPRHAHPPKPEPVCLWRPEEEPAD